ncbi:MAG: tRNA 2-thiocytidine(32) synthetase TtcA [Bdellovibrionales bacterium]|nr:tRNA 2-thiocytidine(32) synthetase TtcA [Bdellovibrionales bacterium]
MTQALADFKMIEEGDRVLVAVSGGKDSSIMLALLEQIRRRAPFQFEIEAAILDQKQPGFEPKSFLNWVNSLGIKLTVLEEDTYTIVKDKVEEGKTYCSLCSRLRRGILYNYAHENGFTKLALGHHRDDLIETLMLNMFYSGKMATMPPKLYSKDARNIVIRPLAYVKEQSLLDLQVMWGFPVIPCNLCGSQDGLKRVEMKKMLADLRKKIPHVDNSLLSAMSNVLPSHLLDESLKPDH